MTPNFMAWDIINRKWMSKSALYDLPYGELFFHTPDSRAINLYIYIGLKDRKEQDVCEGHYLRDTTDDEIYEVVYIKNTASFEMRELSSGELFSFDCDNMKNYHIVGHQCTHAHVYDPHSEHAKYSKEVAEAQDESKL